MWKNILDSSFGMLGEKQLANRATLLIIHGAGGNIEPLKPFWQSLEAHFNLAAINLPGRDNAHKSLDNISALAAYIMGFVAGSATVKPWLVGHSLGAAAALEVARKWQTSLAGLLLFNTAPMLPLNEGFMLSLASNFPPTITRFLCKAYGPDSPPEMVEACLKLVQGLPRGTVVNDFKACRTYNALPYLKDITLPAMVATGDNDVVTRPGEGKRLAAILPNAKHISLGAVGHMGPYEAPELAAREITGFIKEYGIYGNNQKLFERI